MELSPGVLNPKQVRHLIERIAQNDPNLTDTQSELSGQKLGPQDCEIIVRALVNNNTLRVLNLTSKLGD
eukprot:CAMPEP_0184288202 /NCGR_PEP_ID=MMETSP1049-20130417/682_1 /TAXON_ID=77928 /ORGANISM="Proteomonas sulcata, Strain CCMP704" /LENGTH=68 /DNA_ID=CAMNT_0026594443 /DNA_START=223 /DNA_END=429 /DNA_ORIENTATION=+